MGSCVLVKPPSSTPRTRFKLPDSYVVDSSLVFPQVMQSLTETLAKKALCDGTIARCSSFEALAAHVWKAQTKTSSNNNKRKGGEPLCGCLQMLVTRWQIYQRITLEMRCLLGAGTPGLRSFATPLCVRKIQAAIGHVPSGDHCYPSTLWLGISQFIEL
ncbi:hypothetical protein SELMODRAFT_427382 [Selaginella moellendorffii]|uniref:Uncharacterized protein n=1 Tax=Selaginella moellendorffii TaxID=88036 RepID=D8SZE8_SELML|nr:hypothetical protein SELMODRAFT_427382 [Selaginella moellendorffii]